MPIPGLKVLDEIIAGLPTNSAQRIEIGKLKEQLAAIEKDNERLKIENDLLKQVATSVIAKKEDDLVRIGGGYFKKGPTGGATGYAHCVPCWEMNKRLVSVTHMLGDAYRCPSCRNLFQGDVGWPSEARQH